MTEPNDEQKEALKREALAWITRFSLGEATDADLAALRKWRDISSAHAAALADAGQLWRELETPVAALARGGTVSAPLRKRAEVRPSRRMVLTGSAAAAAVAGIALVRPPLDLWPSLAEMGADHRTGTGEQRHLALTDAVSVDLNTRTSITLRTHEREGGIELISGETAITIVKAPEKPFVIVAGNGRITATLATFNVRRDGPEVHLTCMGGQVTAECDNRRASLERGQQVSYDGQGLRNILEADAGVVSAWRDGMLVFRNTPLVDVIEEVNRYRPGRIVLLDSGLGQRLVTARFEIKRLDTVMGQIGSVFKVPVKSLPGGLVFVG